MIVDAVGVCENDKTDSRPLERKKNVSFEKLMESVAWGNRDEDTLTSLAGRLARLDRALDGKDKREIEEAAWGRSLSGIINALLDTVDPDKRMEKARELFGTETPSEEQVVEAGVVLINDACAPLDDPGLRNTIIDIKKRNEQVIDNVSSDTVLFAGFSEQAKEKAQGVINTFKQFIKENKDELTALQIIYSKPYGRRHLTFLEIKKLAEAIEKPPYYLTPEVLWKAYEQLDRLKVKGAGPHKLLTNIISLIRFATGESNVLEPFPETVDHRFESWIEEQDGAGISFTPEQKEWLLMIKNHIASSVSIEKDDFENVPFNQKGGMVKAYQLFGQELDSILTQLNEALAA
jgi:type I restriction enzyme R subunit